MSRTIIQRMKDGSFWTGYGWSLKREEAWRFYSSRQASELIRTKVRAREFESGSCRLVGADALEGVK